MKMPFATALRSMLSSLRRERKARPDPHEGNGTDADTHLPAPAACADVAPWLHEAANGHLTIDFGDYDTPAYRYACRELGGHFGYVAHGEAHFGMDDGIAPSFWRDGHEIACGWDTWSGSYLLSESDEADETLRRLFARIAAGQDTPAASPDIAAQ